MRDEQSHDDPDGMDPLSLVEPRLAEADTDVRALAALVRELDDLDRDMARVIIKQLVDEDDADERVELADWFAMWRSVLLLAHERLVLRLRVLDLLKR